MHVLGAFLVIAATLAVASAGFRPHCDPPDVPHYGGHSNYGKHSYRVGSVVYFYCNRGYKLHGYTGTVCVYDKHRGAYYWLYPSPVCKRVFDDDDDDDDSDDSHSDSDSDSTTKRVYCGKLSNPRYGVVRLTGTSVGSKAKYSCNDGFILVGDDTRECLKNGKWSGEAPVCKRVDCGDLDDPDNGRIELSGTTVGSKAVYSCNRGFFLSGNSKRVCQNNGEWSGDAPVCKPVDCGDLDDPDNGRVDLTGTTYLSKATYSCNKGFELIGGSRRDCQADGEWSGDAPVCIPVDCGDLDDPDYGRVDLTGTTFGSKATYSCNKGFILVGNSKRECQANGKWSGDDPICKRVDCGDLDDPDYGMVDLTGTAFGSKATYSCNKGFKLIGDSRRDCQADGEWSGDAPICKRIDCGDLHNPKYGWVHVKCTYVGCKAIYDCNHGFRLKGVYKRYCQSNGYWSDHAPVCVRKY